jgi:hypothetical protein
MQINTPRLNDLKRNEMNQSSSSKEMYKQHRSINQLTPILVQESHSQHNIYSQVASATSPTDLWDQKKMFANLQP